MSKKIKNFIANHERMHKHFNPANPYLSPLAHTNTEQKHVDLNLVNRGKLILLWLEVCRRKMDPVPSRYWPEVKKDFQKAASPYFNEVCFKHDYNWTPEGVIIHTRTSKFGGEGVMSFSFEDPLNVCILTKKGTQFVTPTEE